MTCWFRASPTRRPSSPRPSSPDRPIPHPREKRENSLQGHEDEGKCPNRVPLSRGGGWGGRERGRGEGLRALALTLTPRERPLPRPSPPNPLSRPGRGGRPAKPLRVALPLLPVWGL